jgi:HPt (histidine-containing phosphotransfer) domain-containing protein
MNDYLSKPLDASLFRQRLRYWLAVGIEGGDGDGTEPAPVGEEREGLVDERVLRQLGRDVSAEVLPDILGIYLDETAERIPRMLRQHGESDLGSLGDEAHALKSSSGSFGALRLQAAAREIELAAKAGDGAGVDRAMTGLASLAQRSTEELKRYLENGPPAAG